MPVRHPTILLSVAYQRTRHCSFGCPTVPLKLIEGTNKVLMDKIQAMPISKHITYELLGFVVERSSNIVSLFKELENIRIDA
jgi:hypothetical protein